MDIREARTHRSRRLPHLPRLHELRRRVAWRAPVGARRGVGPPVLSSRPSTPASTSSTPPTCTRSDRARSSSAGRCKDLGVEPRRGRDRDQGARPDAPGTERCGPVPQGDPRRGRPQPAPAGHRLHRPVPDPPARPAHADRGDARGAARRREGGQGALPRRVVDVGVAVRQGAAHLADAQRLDEVRLHAGPLQPPQPGGGARDAAALPRPGRRRDPVEPARAGPARPPVGRGHRHARSRTRSARRSTTRRPTG